MKITKSFLQFDLPESITYRFYFQDWRYWDYVFIDMFFCFLRLHRLYLRDRRRSALKRSKNQDGESSS